MVKVVSILRSCSELSVPPELDEQAAKNTEQESAIRDSLNLFIIKTYVEFESRVRFYRIKQIEMIFNTSCKTY